MQNAALAYGTVAKQYANPRELEADLLLKAAARLQAIHDAWDRSKPDLDEALLYNRKLWSIFLTSVTEPESSPSGRDPAERRQSRPVRHESVSLSVMRIHGASISIR